MENAFRQFIVPRIMAASLCLAQAAVHVLGGEPGMGDTAKSPLFARPRKLGEQDKAKPVRRMSRETAAYFDARCRDIEAAAEEWERLARERPHQPVWAELAAEARNALKSVGRVPIVEQDMSTWVLGDGGAAAAYTETGTLYVDDDFATPELSDKQKELLRGEALEKARRKVRSDRIGREGVIVHESIHIQQYPILRKAGELEAYRREYRYLRARGQTEADDEMYKVQDQLVARGVLKKIGETQALDKELGLDPILEMLRAAERESESGRGGQEQAEVDPVVAEFRSLWPGYLEQHFKQNRQHDHVEIIANAVQVGDAPRYRCAYNWWNWINTSNGRRTGVGYRHDKVFTLPELRIELQHMTRSNAR
ncbi:MAG: hypothetical protein JXR37_22105 [Kiritimatiellae bacterium]|nr:hypothetical protein [Kiritimatiellia bacterium]